MGTLSRFGVFAVVAACSSSGGSGDTSETTGGDSSDDSSTGGSASSDDASPDSTGTTEPGEPFMPAPVGDPVSATIGADGGTITSSDGRLTLVIPASALDVDTLVEVQQVEWQDGFAWELRPAGTEFAVAVQATITLQESETGDVIVTDVDGVSSIEAPDAQPFHVAESGVEETAAMLAWREADAEIDWTIELTHFSWVGVLVKPGVGVVTSQHANVFVGDTLAAGVRSERGEFQTLPVVLNCPDPRTFELSRRGYIADMDVVLDDELLEKIGDVEMSGTFEASYAFQQQLRCTAPGTATGALRWKAATELEAGVDLGSCVLPPTPDVFFEFRVSCLEPCTGTDPVDVGQLPDGDPSLDLVCVKTGVTRNDDDEDVAWVRVTFDGPWRPPEEHWSWFSRVTFGFAGGSTGAFVTEHHVPSMPADSQFTEGMLPIADVTYTEEANGYLLVLAPGYTEMVQTVAVESGLQKVPPTKGVFVPDAIATTMFDATSSDP